MRAWAATWIAIHLLLVVAPLAVLLPVSELSPSRGFWLRAVRAGARACLDTPCCGDVHHHGYSSTRNAPERIASIMPWLRS